MSKNDRSDDILIVVEADKKTDQKPDAPVGGTCPPEQPKVKPQSRKRMIIRTVFLVIISAISIGIMLVLPEKLNAESSKTLGEIFGDMNVSYFVLAIGIWVLMMLLDATKFFLVGRVAVGRASVLTSFKVAFLGKYYDNIVPFSAGEPFQIMYLNKKGYSGGQSSAIVLIKFFVQMFAWLLVSALLMIFWSGALDELGGGLATTLKVGAWIGFAFTAIPPTTIVMFIFMPKVAYKLINGAAWLLFKLKIIKDKQKLINRATKITNDFLCCLSIISKRPLYFALLIVICFMEPIVTLSFPYFLVVSFAHVPPSFATLLQVMALNIFAMYSVVIMPTPGNSGFIETTFTLAFSGIVSSVLFGVTFTWRFFTYYFYILVGLGISLYEIVRNIVRSKRQRKQEKS